MGPSPGVEEGDPSGNHAGVCWKKCRLPHRTAPTAHSQTPRSRSEGLKLVFLIAAYSRKYAVYSFLKTLRPLLKRIHTEVRHRRARGCENRWGCCLSWVPTLSLKLVCCWSTSLAIVGGGTSPRAPEARAVPQAPVKHSTIF